MLENVPIPELGLALGCIVLASGFFAAAETAMMALNRYRLRHLVHQGHRVAKRTQALLARPDRLLGVILIGNTFLNIFASSLATVLAVHLLGDIGVPIAAVGLTVIILIFSEIAPKTVAALYPQKLAFLFSWPLFILLKLFYPLVWLGTVVSNGLLRLFCVKVNQHHAVDAMSYEELRTVVHEGRLPLQDRAMLLSILELEQITVEDIMIPRREIIGINIEEDWDEILQTLCHCCQTRLPVYKGSIEEILGILPLRSALKLSAYEELSKDKLKDALLEPYFVPESTSLGVQLLNFRKAKRRDALVVNEYGEIQGLVTLESILEEIVGEFIVDIDTVRNELHFQEDHSYIVDGSITLRELNKLTEWNLPTDGPKTLSGLIIEKLEEIPRSGTAIKIMGYPVEVMNVKDNKVRTAKIFPKV